jgi:uncharacterized protein (TIGR03083 family)
MPDQDRREHVRAVGRAARAEAEALAARWREWDAAAWEAPSACAGWAVKDVAAHITEGASRVIPVVRATLAGDPTPQFTAEERAARTRDVRALPGAELATRFPRDVDAVFVHFEGADEGALATTVVVPAGPHTLAELATQRLLEAALHAWDCAAPRDPAAALRPEAAAPLVDYLLDRVGRMATGDLGGLTATYHLELSGPGGGPLTLTLADGQAMASRGASAAADATLTLPAEAWVRLVWGRLDLDRALAAGTARASGDEAKARALSAVFRGR